MFLGSKVRPVRRADPKALLFVSKIYERFIRFSTYRKSSKMEDEIWGMQQSQ
jgi:hypothetical protein